MPAAGLTWHRRTAPGLPVAIVIHAALLAWLASVAIQQFDVAPVAEQSVEVELQSQEEFEALTRPPPPVLAAAPAPLPVQPAPQPAAPAEPASPSATPAEPAARAAAPTEPDGMVRPRRMLSQRVLADPRSRETLAALPRLAPDERIEQLCGLEAMARSMTGREASRRTA